MRKLETDILIVGAGPAGLAAAMELSKEGKDFIIVEKDAAVGGLAKTYTFKEGDLEFRTDNGPHRFFSKNKYLYDFIEGLIHEKWIIVHRQTRQFIDGKFYDYPINALQALKNVGLWKAFRMLSDYVTSKFRYALFKKPISNFADYVYANFGKTLGEFSMINYTEKIWGIPATEIHADWAGQRIKGLSISSLIRDMFRRIFGVTSKNKPKTLVDTFYYPEYGTGLIYETIVEELRKKDYQILLEAQLRVFKHSNKKFTSVVMRDKAGEETEIAFEKLVESVPLTKFITMLEPEAPKDVLDAAKKLRHRSQVYLFITLDKDSITKDQWIYFPNKDVPIGRVSEMKNFSDKMSPAGKTSLFIEFFCFEGDEIWNKTDKELFDFAMPHIEAAKLFMCKEVRKYYLIKQKDVYPIYDLHYKTFLDKIKKYLDGFSNLYYIGRPGRFRYNNQDHSLEMGMLAAKSIVDGKKYDIENVGEEKEYYESGKLYNKKDN